MRSITFKLTLAFLMVGLTGALLVAFILQWRTRKAFDQFIVTREQEIWSLNLIRYYQENGSWAGVEDRLNAIVESPGRDLPGREIPAQQEILVRDLQRYILVGPNGRVVWSPQAGQIGDPVAKRNLDRAYALEVNGVVVGWLAPRQTTREWLPNSPEARFLAGINSAAFVSALVAALLALILGSLLAFSMTRSLRELTDATIAIARGKLGGQVKVRSDDELGNLAVSFNRMSTDLARSTHVRQQMTADIAHELRSPLSVISGYAEALSDGKLPGTPEVYAILNQEAKHLSRLVEDLRTLSLADAGELSLNLAPLHPRELLQRLAARHAVAAGTNGVRLRVEAGPDLPAVQIDSERMAQVLDNLILNAFRYTLQGGEVVLSAGLAAGWVQIQVHDTGTGISAEDLPKIFDRFYRGDRARQQNGESGLGLAIARSLVEAHGGSIRAESSPAAGTTFTILLKPVAQAG